MKTLIEIENIIKSHKDELEKKYHVKTIGIFGSYARNEQEDKSDLDVLIDFAEPVGFFSFLDLEEYLENLLELKIDLVTPNALKPYMGKMIIEEVRYL